MDRYFLGTNQLPEFVEKEILQISTHIQIYITQGFKFNCCTVVKCCAARVYQYRAVNKCKSWSRRVQESQEWKHRKKRTADWWSAYPNWQKRQVR